jgi:hypothetical protein
VKNNNEYLGIFHFVEMIFSKSINYWKNICWNGQGNMVTKSSIVNHNLVHKLQIIVMVSLGLQISNYISLISRPHKELCILRHELPTPAIIVKPSNSIIPLRPSFPPAQHIMPPFFQDDAPNCQTSVIFILLFEGFHQSK